MMHNFSALYLGKDVDGYIRMPRGQLEELEAACDKAGIEYDIIDHREKGRPIRVKFNVDDFHHLIGLHKLKDNDFVRTTKRSKIFHSIIDGKLTEASIRSSQYYPLVKERMDAFSNIVSILETVPQMFRYSVNRAGSFSRINADYLVYHAGNEKIYLFLKKRTTTDMYACISLFFERQTDYMKRASSMRPQLFENSEQFKERVLGMCQGM